MTEEDVLIHAYGSDIFKKWHWFCYHFERHMRGGSHPFAHSIVRASTANRTSPVAPRG
jgi:hypothetical protein